MKRHVWIAGSLFAIMTLSAVSMAKAQRNEGVWEERNAPMPTEREYYSTSTVNGKIYAIGGSVWNNGKPILGRVLATVEEYNPSTNRWIRRANMRIARSSLSTSVVDGVIYVMGGNVQIGWKRNHVEAYDPAKDTWVKKTDMSMARDGFATSVVDGKIFAMDSRSTEVYDPVADVWRDRAMVPTRRSGFCTSVVDGVIYAFGGRDWEQGEYLKAVEAYCPLADRWKKRARMPQARGRFATSVVGGKVYVLGGHDNDGNRIRTIDVYDPETDTWEQVGKTPDLVPGFSTCVVGWKVYAFTVPRDIGHSVLVYTPPFRPPQSVTPMSKAATTLGRVKSGR